MTMLFIIAAFAISTALHAQQFVTAQTAQLTIGSEAPELKLQKMLQAPPGARIDREESLKGKVVVLDFWATWCSPCIAAMPNLNQLAEEFSGQPIVFISITDDEIDRLGNFLKTRPMKTWIDIIQTRTSTQRMVHHWGQTLW